MNLDSVCNIFHYLPLSSVSKPGEGRGGEVWENGEREERKEDSPCG